MTETSTASSSVPTRRTVRILSLNVWGLAFFSKARDIRIAAIATRLAASDYDIVALQEMWCESTDWKDLRTRCSARFPYSKFFYSGAFGSGLAILSRYPITSSQTHPYTLNGHPILVHHGDWIVAKAAGCATIDIEGLGPVDLWNTHTVAAGGEDGPESRRAHRVAQAYEMAKFVKNSAERGRHVVCVGDFNSTPPSLSIAILRDVGQLTDAFLQSRPHLPAHAVSLPLQRGVRPDPRRSIIELGVTCDSPLNTWTAGKPLDERAKKGAGKRLDYVFFRGPVQSTARDIQQDGSHRQGRLRCRESKVVFTELIEGHEMSYSDHFGLEATLEILDQGEANAEVEPASNTEQEAHSFYNPRLAQTLTSSLSALASSLSAARLQQRKTYLLFLALLILAFSSIGFAASKTTGGHGFGAFWTLLAVVCGWTGSTALYSAVVWGEWEKRALRTFLESMELDLSLQRGLQTSPTLPRTSLSTSTPLLGGSEQSTMDGGNSSSRKPQRLISVDDEAE